MNQDLERQAIRRHFNLGKSGKGVVLGIGDDAAVLSFGSDVVISTDTMVCGTHFAPDADPYFLGRKSLSAALSDLAAMGSAPTHALLSLTLERLEDQWLARFAEGFFSVAKKHKVALAGGDLCRGRLSSVTVTVLGEAKKKFLRQSGAKAGDDVWVSGRIGQAGDELRAGAPAKQGSALHDPSAQIALGTALVGVASAAMDLSDGLCAGACAMARSSKCRIDLEGGDIPVAGKGKKAVTQDRLVEAICSGEDYQLLFTAPKNLRDKVAAIGSGAKVRLSRIGSVKKGKGAFVSAGKEILDCNELEAGVFAHFGDIGNDLASDRLHGSLVQDIAKAALASKSRVCVAESCTGGLLAATLTSVAGSSDWFEGGAVTYSVRLKHDVLGVSLGTVKKHGVVSEQVASEMCAGALRAKGTTHAVAITGWAGPDGGDGQPAGLVCIGWAGKDKIVTKAFNFSGGRDMVRRQAVAVALEGLHRTLAAG